MSVIDDIDDHGFVLATELIVELCQEVEKLAGQKPTIDDLCELLTWGLRGCSLDLLADVNTSNVLRIEAKLKKRGKITLKPGDIVAIPAKDGGWHLVVFITKNRFGFAYGILLGRHALKPPSPQWQPEALAHPIYSGQRAVASGRWQVVGNNPDLLALFPSDPPIYHSKMSWPNEDQIGPFGSAESASDRLRPISKQEAKEVGLLTGEYRCVLMEDEFEEFLANRLG